MLAHGPRQAAPQVNQALGVLIMSGHSAENAAQVLRDNPLPKFMVIVHVRLHKPISEAGHRASEVIGYYQALGVATHQEQLRQVVEDAVAEEGRVDWSGTKYREVTVEGLAADVRARIEPLEGAGVWYLSGHAYYPAGDA